MGTSDSGDAHELDDGANVNWGRRGVQAKQVSDAWDVPDRILVPPQNQAEMMSSPMGRVR